VSLFDKIFSNISNISEERFVSLIDKAIQDGSEIREKMILDWEDKLELNKEKVAQLMINYGLINGKPIQMDKTQYLITLYRS